MQKVGDKIRRERERIQINNQPRDKCVLIKFYCLLKEEKFLIFLIEIKFSKNRVKCSTSVICLGG